jgi:hypothetical protein
MRLIQLDKTFSEYIRRRDTDLNGMVKCCTCPTRKHWKQMDAGHWIRRGKLGVRYNERNCHAQCVICNQYKQGNIEVYDRFILNKYGMSVFDELIELSEKDIKWMQFEIKEMTEYFKEKIKNLDT